MERIILDTCFILTALKQKIDIKSELERILNKSFRLYIIDKTLDELKGKKDEKLAKAIIKKIKCTNIKTEQPKSNVDSLIINHTKNHPNITVATQDRALKEKLKKRNIRLITIRQKKYLKITN